MKYFYSEELKTLFVTYTGLLSDIEIAEHVRSMKEDACVSLVDKIIVDLRAADSSSRSTSAITQLARDASLDGKIDTEKVRVAIVASNDLAFGNARMYQTYAGGDDNYHVFRDMNDAADWIGIPLDEIERMRSCAK